MGNRTTYLPYAPGNPPVLEKPREITRAVWDELIRVAQSLVDLDRPVAAAYKSSESLPVGATAVYQRLFDQGLSYQWEKPGGCMDAATGIFTIPQEGLYQIYARFNVPPFPSPATKSYTALLRSTIVWANGDPNLVNIAQNGGLDDQYITVQGTILIPFKQGDKIYFDGAIIHATKTGTVTVEAALEVIRISGTT